MTRSESANGAASSISTDALDQRVRMAAQLWRLSRRQTEVLALLLEGGANKDVAAALGCAEVTVEKHLTAIFRAADLRGRAQLRATVHALEPSALRSRAESVAASREETRRCG